MFLYQVKMLCKKAYTPLMFYATVTKTQINILANSIANRLYISLLQINNKTKFLKPIV